MSQTRLSEYAEVSYENEKANPVKIAARGSTADGHEFGDAGEIYLTDDEARELGNFLNEIYDL